MEAKLEYGQLDCWNLSFGRRLRKEESQDAVVPDTMPDAGRIIHVGGGLLIRSKDVSGGRLKLEANIPAKVVFSAEEDGSLHCVEVNVPVFISCEDGAIGDNDHCFAELKLLELEARLLNPRKIMVRAEIGAELSCYEKCCLEYALSGAEGENIYCRSACRELSCLSAAAEKTFALSDEQKLPPEIEGGEIVSARAEPLCDEYKQLGSKLIVKGRIKSSLLLLNCGKLKALEASTEFSQIVECGGEQKNVSCMSIIPSGSHYGLSPEGRLCMEFHLVLQLLCCERKAFECMDDAYSNRYQLSIGRREYPLESFRELPSLQGSSRQLFELRDMEQIISCTHTWGEPRQNGDKTLLPVNLRCLYASPEGELKCEKLSGELAFDVMPGEGESLQLREPELCECSLAPLPGGVELRLSARAKPLLKQPAQFDFIGSVSYDENSPRDNSVLPSLVLLRASSGDDLWKLARENCSTVEAILRANELQSAQGDWEKLLLIPKSL